MSGNLRAEVLDTFERMAKERNQMYRKRSDEARPFIAFAYRDDIPRQTRGYGIVNGIYAEDGSSNLHTLYHGLMTSGSEMIGKHHHPFALELKIVNFPVLIGEEYPYLFVTAGTSEPLKARFEESDLVTALGNEVLRQGLMYGMRPVWGTTNFSFNDRALGYLNSFSDTALKLLMDMALPQPKVLRGHADIVTA